MFTIMAKSILQCECLYPDHKDDSAMIECAKRLDMLMGICFLALSVGVYLNNRMDLSIAFFSIGSVGTFLFLERMLDLLIENKKERYDRAHKELFNV